jgi:hypothetical protein
MDEPDAQFEPDEQRESTGYLGFAISLLVLIALKAVEPYF